MNTPTGGNKYVELAEAAIARRFKEGRGSGSGQNYQPSLLSETSLPKDGSTVFPVLQ